MLFFYGAVSEFDKNYSTLFGIKTGEDDEERNKSKNESGVTEEVRGNTFYDKWGWIDCVRVVSDLVHSPWDVVFKMNVVEFLNLLSFNKDYNAERERVMKEKFKLK